MGHSSFFLSPFFRSEEWRLFDRPPGFFGQRLDGRLIGIDLERPLEKRQRLVGPAQVEMALPGQVKDVQFGRLGVGRLDVDEDR